ncbi:hypothetical protein QBC32DRAFT_30199 [Pseudoneurospora amorphoporcata]|uniref:Uncharacterized protein n=1 Tax=Pseudoneurospora amorphoporcata TaxID=241081 RepID=A0AAN6NPU0_9PEZI|nr:hypothetical protein QBC32DRAFT_30199 [Pseudoneurospora amorphoporcata]
MPSEPRDIRPYPEFHQELHQLPEKGVPLSQLHFDPDPQGRKRHMASSTSQKRKITIQWLCRTAEDTDHPFAVAQRSQTEEICRAEADELGLNYVAIRNGLYNLSVLYENGMPVTFYNRETQRWQKKIHTVDWHLTVWMGKFQAGAPATRTHLCAHR